MLIGDGKMELNIESVEAQLKSIQSQRHQIEQEFLRRYPTIIDGKDKKYALSGDGRYYTDISQVPDKDKPLFVAGLKNGADSFMPGALYYETDHIRQTNLDDMKKYPEWNDKVDELRKEEQRLSDMIKQSNMEKTRNQIQEQQETSRNMKLLRQTFPGADLTDSYYEVAEDGKSAYKIMKSLEQLSAEKEALYQRLSQIEGTVQQKKEILDAIDKVYDGYISRATIQQNENKPAHK